MERWHIEARFTYLRIHSPDTCRHPHDYNLDRALIEDDLDNMLTGR